MQVAPQQAAAFSGRAGEILTNLQKTRNGEKVGAGKFPFEVQ